MIKAKTMTEWPDEDYSYPLPDVSQLSEKEAGRLRLKGVQFMVFGDREQITSDEEFELCITLAVLWNWHHHTDDEYYEEIVNVLKKIKSVKIVRIFGSRANGSCGEFSDIDLIFEGNYTQDGFLRIKKKLQKLKIPYFTDIYDVHYRMKPFIFRNTLRSRVFYRRSDYFEDDFVSFLEKE